MPLSDIIHISSHASLFIWVLPPPSSFEMQSTREHQSEWIAARRVSAACGAWCCLFRVLLHQPRLLEANKRQRSQHSTAVECSWTVHSSDRRQTRILYTTVGADVCVCVSGYHASFFKEQSGQLANTIQLAFTRPAYRESRCGAPWRCGRRFRSPGAALFN